MKVSMRNGTFVTLNDENIEYVLSKSSKERAAIIKKKYGVWKAQKVLQEKHDAKIRAAADVKARKEMEMMGKRTIITENGPELVSIEEFNKLVDSGELDSTGKVIPKKPVKKKRVRKKKDDRDEVNGMEPEEQDDIKPEEVLSVEDFEIDGDEDE
jgi:hypothetical protein